MYLIFDTETTGLPKDFTKPISDFDNWNFARCVQIGWQLHDKYGKLIDVGNDIIKPDDFDIPQVSIKINGITNEKANKCGISIKDSLKKTIGILAEMTRKDIQKSFNLKIFQDTKVSRPMKVLASHLLLKELINQ